MHWGRPKRAQKLGITTRNLNELREYVFMELDPQFNEQNYDALANNCNHFADTIAKFLLGRGIPDEVRLQPERMMSAPTAWIFKPLLSQLLTEASPSSKSRSPLQVQRSPSWYDWTEDGSTSASSACDEGAGKITLSSGSASPKAASDSEESTPESSVKGSVVMPMKRMRVQIVCPPGEGDITPRFHHQVQNQVAALQHQF